MRTGRLRHRIKVEINKPVDSDFGEQVDDWKSERTVWGGIESLTGNQVISGQREIGEVTHKVVLRYYAGLTTDNHRITHKGRAFTIVHINNRGGRNADMELLCKESV
jgi:SPP1 family predicted phage head-tail adaptor